VTTKPNRILIAGAGIGGLATASALSRRGFEVEIAEAAERVRTVGAGITIQPNAMAVLDSLGIQLDPSDLLPIGEVAMLDASGRSLMGGDFSEMGERSGANVRRADLHRALLASVGEIPLRLSSPVTSVVDEGDGCTVTLGACQQEKYDAVIGADGIMSQVRRSILPTQECELRFAHQRCWRFTVEAPELQPKKTVERWFSGCRVGVVPLSRGGTYVYIVQSAAPGGLEKSHADPGWVQEHLGPVDDRLPDLLKALERSAEPHVHCGDLCDQPHVSYGLGRVLLLGDAAHALTPNMGQGAAMAIEDAGALALIAREKPVHRWAETLEALRARRVREIAKTSWRIGQMAHWRGATARSLRDLMMRMTPKSTTDRMVSKSWSPGIELAASLANSKTPAPHFSD